MADEAHYGSESNKRKYDDNQTPPPRRQTGFSAPISSHSPPDGGSYNSVPPPMEDIEIAKQKAQEIAARIFNSAEATKRPRVENGDSIEPAMPQKPIGMGSAPSIPSSYGGGYPAPGKKIDIPNGRVGVIIGKGGETIKFLQSQSGAKIQVTRDMDADPHSLTRGVELVGTPEAIAKAEELIRDVLNEAEAGNSGTLSRRVPGGSQTGSEIFVMQVPNNKVGLVIGKGGETIKNMQARTGARIQVIPLHLPPGDTSTERTLQIEGSSDVIEAAKQLVNEVISENRMRNPAMGGGYSQQGYQARPPTSWAPPAPPMQQPGYGYIQPGAYPGPAPQYNMSQPPYSGYPPQPTSGGYAGSWDQTATSNQQTSQGGYDFYGQQQQQASQQQVAGSTGAVADNTAAYGYSQPNSGYGQVQGYSQDGYGGYGAPTSQSGYGQPQQNTGYDQQQGYNSTSGYGSVTNPPTEGQTPSYGTQTDGSQAPTGQQGYAAGQQQPSPNTNYPPQGATGQTGYGVPPAPQAGYATQPQTGYGSSYATPPTQKPPSSQQAYGAPQQSPTAAAAGGYGYPPSQAGYPPSEARPTSYAPPTSQAGGYGAAAYGAPPASQSSYGQVPPYSGAYGGGYAQPPAYSSDGSAAGNGRGSYEAAPASQGTQPSGVSKEA